MTSGSKTSAPISGRSAKTEGTTLIEVLVALVLLTIFLPLAFQLLLEVAKVQAQSVRRARQPYSAAATALLRDDLRRARATGASELWTSAPLPIERLDGRTVIWQLDDHRLVRAAAGSLPAARRLLADVGVWRWRRHPSGLVEVEIGVRRDTSRWVDALGSGRPPHGSTELVLLHVVGAPRGQGARTW